MKHRRLNLRVMPVAALAVLMLALTACGLLSPSAETPPVPTSGPSLQVTPFEAGGGGETSVPASDGAEAASGVSYEGVAFTVPASLASEVYTETVPREDMAADEGPYWASTPEYLLFTFEGYPVDDPVLAPAIYVYPAAEFAEVNEFAGQVIGDLSDLLAARPETPPDPIPFFPIFNAGQVFHTHYAYLDFASGSGVRFVTHYSQAPIVVANDNIFYTFQGMSADGAWVVSAVLPVTSPILPARSDEPPDGDWNAFAENYAEYLPALVADLDAQPTSSFAPDLDTLDEMIASIHIEQ